MRNKIKTRDKKVLDINNYQHIYNEEEDLLGEGGQGAVYRTKDGDTALKIDNDKEVSLEKFKKKMERLIYKPLLDLDIITPLVLLKEQKGYVMKLLDNFKSLITLTPNGVKPDNFKEEEIPFFLQAMFKSNRIWACKITHYKNTGGLRMRLFILKRIACILSALHLRGMVYCDLSPNNVFVSDSEKPIVKFIDADNIEYQSKIQSRIYTPNYEIPEIDKGNNSMYSDIYAFGILAFYLLTMAYPFVEIERDWDSDNEQSKKIWEGEWIDGKQFSGEYTEGLRGILSTEPLKDLFSTTFEEAKLTPHKRPIMPLWIKVIENALNDTLRCPKCEMSYYDSYVESCPYCGEIKPLRVMIETKRARFVRELDSQVEVPLSLIEIAQLSNNKEILFSIKKDKNNVIIEKKCDKKLRISNKEIFRQYKRPIDEFRHMTIEVDAYNMTLRIGSEI
ncbi:protein kinase domain-containing protein [Helicobacter trogontum]|nr:hypothetical protein [Helicobacter trogontum]